MSFLSDRVPNSELPLLINFEAKSIADKFNLTRQTMENRHPDLTYLVLT